ncbi:MAG: hypothetical protein AVDCRST_MAG36-579 [uncultured Nocardioidaceae bacterium]|uniref:EamA domain-containing protein n=1 Tax=uncultured Nocardioidaceae bacterium TaxID=253824 RepID=A0A6J4L298_9ACTN|nr:MAG: hypothetical protein AVDCRST_MAG36-579 [uncultured Nocardioidaceae bacterium]
MVAILVALLSSVLGGGADFLGGYATKRVPVFLVAATSQAGAAAVLLALVLLLRPSTPSLGYMPWAIAAGLTLAAGLVAFYSALATGTMGIVAPITALGVVVPLTWGLATGDSPSSLQGAGIAVAVIGVVLASGPEVHGVTGPRPILLACGAGLFFGASLTFLAEAATANVLPTLLTMKVAAALLLAAGVMWARSGPDAYRARGAVPTFALIALADVTAYLCLTFALSVGPISVISVLGSLYPAVTVILARIVLRERLGLVQVAGVAVVFVGVVLISAGR